MTPPVTLGLSRQPDYTGALAAQQREEDERAAAWVEGEISRHLSGPTVTWSKGLKRVDLLDPPPVMVRT